MTITVPVAVPAPGLPLADPADRATFTARKLEHLRWEREDLAPGVLALAEASEDNALDAQANAVTVAANTAAVAANTALAASYAGAIPWVSGTTYTIGDRRTSLTNGLVYRRITSGAGATDPSADGTNWQIVQVAPPVIIVSGTTQTAVAGTHYVLTNVATSTLTLPAAPSAGDLVWVTTGNSLTTNVVDRNGNNIEGAAANFTLTASYPSIQLRYINATLGWMLV